MFEWRRWRLRRRSRVVDHLRAPSVGGRLVIGDDKDLLIAGLCNDTATRGHPSIEQSISTLRLLTVSSILISHSSLQLSTPRINSSHQLTSSSSSLDIFEMAFYSHNPFLPQQRRQAPYGYGHPFHTVSVPNYQYSAYDDLDLEEQAALAHLASVRQRREASELQVQREAAIRAQVAAQREAAIAAAVERERLREQAIRRALAIQEERRVIAQEQAQQEHLRRLAARKAQQDAFAARAVEENKRRTECARRCGGPCHRAERSSKSDEQDWKQINDVLGSLFGFTLNNAINPPTHNEEKENKDEKKDNAIDRTSAEPSQVKVDEKVDDPVESVPSAPASGPVVKESTPASTAFSTEDPRIVTDLSDLVSKFLGINLSPAAADEKPTEGADALTARVNEFLGQFGLEFEPESVEVKKPTSAKGKEVAEGEKPARPQTSTPPARPKSSPEQSSTTTQTTDAPAPETASTAALNKLRDISHELHLATESFTFPSHLAFAPTPSADEVTPPLLFNKSNSGYHAQAHKLLQLLLAADGVSSGGDKEVRRQRKAIVRAIESAIEKLEQKRDEVWNQVKERRNTGEESDDEGSVSSWSTDSAHEAQHIEHAVSPSDQEATAAANIASQEVGTPSSNTEAVNERKDGQEAVEGFEVPTDAEPTFTTAQTEGEDAKAEKEEKDEFELL